MPTYKTPDVYVEEISLLPRSVAEVETAIPAFIGYTEKATDNKKDLTLVPTPVDSLVEFESLFGGEPPVVIQANTLVLDATNNVQSVAFTANYYLFDAIRLFYKNGGGRCYIVSVGNYLDTVTKDELIAGVTAVRKKDEPTMLLAPDAVILGATGIYDVQVEMLKQCSDLMDRFAILDLLETPNWDDGVSEFRTRIGVNYLTYGAAYTPYLRTSLTRTVTYRELKAHIASIRNQASDEVRQTFDNLDKAIKDVDEVRKNGSLTLVADYEEKVQTFKTALNASDLANAQTAFKDLFDFIYTKNVGLVDTWARNPAPEVLATYPGLAVKDIPKATQEKITAVLHDLFKTLNQYCMGVEARTGAEELNNLFTTDRKQATATQWEKAGVNVFDDADLDEDNTIYPIAEPDSDGDRLANMRSGEAAITALFYQFANVVSSILAAADGLETAFEASLVDQYPTYANVARGVGNSLQTVPPSGAVAGVYSSVDGTRGVWKAPANVSLNSVTDVTYIIDNDEQAGLNVDTTAGKSINAIRPFTGRGILVWGARTLAGNDNEWRYVSVRRFFIMVEESLKKSTLWAVFEPNDANLWMKIKSMIENYLIQKWRDGALAGAKPDHAFFVNVGLGSTMTAQDILEGRLIVEVGLAVVRPAEFIILRFSHKMQQS